MSQKLKTQTFKGRQNSLLMISLGNHSFLDLPGKKFWEKKKEEEQEEGRAEYNTGASSQDHFVDVDP